MEKFLNLEGLEYVCGRLRSDLSGKQDILRGQPGQVVGFDSTGAALARNGWGNPNLLDNWYFPSPINQRRQTGYPEWTYSIDRWLVPGESTLTIANGHIVLSNAIDQLFEDKFSADMYTFSYLDANAELHSWSFIVDANGMAQNVGFGSFGYEAEHGFSRLRIQLGYSFTMIAAKLELGPIQTLARQDASGNWVLNDPPPNPALELAKCQRYQMVYNCPESGYGHIAYVMKSQEGIWYGFLHLPSSLRIQPTIKVTGGEPILNIFNAIHNVSDWGVLSLTGNHALIYVSSPADVPKGTWAMLQTTNSPAQLILDSNL